MEDKLSAELGTRIRESRKRAKLTQQGLGRRLGLADHGAVGQWERGKTLPETLNLIFCAEETAASLDYLVWGMGNNIDARIMALPTMLRDSVVLQVTQTIEQAERLAKAHPQVFSAEPAANAAHRARLKSPPFG